MLEDGVGKDDIEGGIWKWQIINGTNLEVCVRKSVACCIAPGTLDLCCLAVDAGYTAGRNDARKVAGHGAGSTTTVE